MSGVSSKKQSETESFASLARTNQGAVWQELRRLWFLFLATNVHLDWQFEPNVMSETQRNIDLIIMKYFLYLDEVCKVCVRSLQIKEQLLLID